MSIILQTTRIIYAIFWGILFEYIIENQTTQKEAPSNLMLALHSPETYV